MPEAADARINNIITILVIMMIMIIILILAPTLILMKNLQAFQIIVLARYLLRVPNPQHQCT